MLETSRWFLIQQNSITWSACAGASSRKETKILQTFHKKTDFSLQKFRSCTSTLAKLRNYSIIVILVDNNGYNKINNLICLFVTGTGIGEKRFFFVGRNSFSVRFVSSSLKFTFACFVVFWGLFLYEDAHKSLLKIMLRQNIFLHIYCLFQIISFKLCTFSSPKFI